MWVSIIIYNEIKTMEEWKHYDTMKVFIWWIYHRYTRPLKIRTLQGIFLTIPTCMFLYTPPTSLFVFYNLLFVLLFVLDFPKIGNET